MNANKAIDFAKEALCFEVDLKGAGCGQNVAFYGVAMDSNPTVTDMVWDGSCFEIFGCSPDRERIGHVFGAIRIGQVYVVPACDDEPARGARLVYARVPRCRS